MPLGPSVSPPSRSGFAHGVDTAWRAVLAAAREADRLAQSGVPATFAVAADGGLEAVPEGDAAAMLAWRPTTGWAHLQRAHDASDIVFDLYLPLCGATTSRAIVVGHLGQSLDGFIATHVGDSQY